MQCVAEICISGRIKSHIVSLATCDLAAVGLSWATTTKARGSSRAGELSGTGPLRNHACATCDRVSGQSQEERAVTAVVAEHCFSCS